MTSAESVARAAGASPMRGAPGRVAEVQAQTRRGLLITGAFVVAAVVAAAIGLGWWVALHLFAVGGLLSAVSAVAQMLAVTWSAAPAPHPLVAGIQRWALAGGAVALVVGRENDWTWLFVAGGTTVVVAVLALAAILLWVRQRAVTDRFAPAIEAYVAALLAGACGMTLGVLLGAGRVAEQAGAFRYAHLALNLFGLIGLVAAGTLPFFVATQARSKMSSRATPTMMRLTFLALAIATGTAAIGAILDRPGITASGLVIYAVGLVLIAMLLPVYAMSRFRWAGPRLVQLLAGLAWWAAMTVALAVVILRGVDDRAVLQALVVGGFAQILVASLAYLGPVLRGGGRHGLTAGFALTRSWVSLAAGNGAAVAALAGASRALAVVLTVWLADIVVRAARLLAGAKAIKRESG